MNELFHAVPGGIRAYLNLLLGAALPFGFVPPPPRCLAAQSSRSRGTLERARRRGLGIMALLRRAMFLGGVSKSQSRLRCSLCFFMPYRSSELGGWHKKSHEVDLMALALWSWWDSNPRPAKEQPALSTCLVPLVVGNRSVRCKTISVPYPAC